MSLRDQVAATAIMMCIADRVETLQGDPRLEPSSLENRRKILSYGNRLFCDIDPVHGNSRHRWGSGSLFRSYYEDYRSFLARPAKVAMESSTQGGGSIIIVHSDLSKFYDRVTPALLSDSLDKLKQANDDDGFFDLAKSVMNWNWHKKDVAEADHYKHKAQIPQFSNVVLPQGLVASGFFANIILLEFDKRMAQLMGTEVVHGIQLLDVCRYVDDLRFVVRVDSDTPVDDVRMRVFTLIRDTLLQKAPGLEVSVAKTIAARYGTEDRPLVWQSRKMGRIQSAISGGFDAAGGEHILNALMALVHAQEGRSDQPDKEGWRFSPATDVRDSTVLRFAAGRYRTVYRSLRPLLYETSNADMPPGTDIAANERESPGTPRTQSDLDDDARAFACSLINQWIKDPSNVRLLRIGLDIWPAEQLITDVLKMLRPYTEQGRHRGSKKRAALYCLAEVFRAAATETGFTEDDETLPNYINISAYRTILRSEAIRLCQFPPRSLPWYVRHQIFLFLITDTEGPLPVRETRLVRSNDDSIYRKLISFVRGDRAPVSTEQFALFAILGRRVLASRPSALPRLNEWVTRGRLEAIADRDPAYALEILAIQPNQALRIRPELIEDLCLTTGSEATPSKTLSDLVLRHPGKSRLRNEINLLRVAAKFLEATAGEHLHAVITPSQVIITSDDFGRLVRQSDTMTIVGGTVQRRGSIYGPPSWCPDGEIWRFQLGYILRFVLTAQVDFTDRVQPPHWREETPLYRPAKSHWLQRTHGLYNGQPAFGDDWLPISEWTEQLLSALLRWPGCRPSYLSGSVGGGRNAVIARLLERISDLSQRISDSPDDPNILPLLMPRPTVSNDPRPLRGCIVQTVVPALSDFTINDLTLSAPEIRRRHRNHLAASLAAIKGLLALRETHHDRKGLDLLIFPELSVHPKDIKTHLIPFARAYKTIIVAGLTFDRAEPKEAYINSAIWIVPIRSPTGGLQILTRRQGKKHLAQAEAAFNQADNQMIREFRPCQWIMGYEWAKDRSPLWLTASVCYDATDIKLAASLRDWSDVYIIPAFNKDVRTFGQMALALHYHMYQYVIVANHGEYGGSNAYVPLSGEFNRQVFHLHGQPQASAAFFEIDDIRDYLTRKGADNANETAFNEDAATTAGKYKHPPAGILRR